MGNRRDRADDSERRVIREGQPTVAGVVVGPEVFDARHARDGVTELADLVIEPANLRFLELGPTELLGLLDADLADAVHGLATIVERPGPERSKRGLGCRNGVVRRGKDAKVARRPRCGFAIAQDSPVAHLGQHFLDDVADDVFGHLHGGHRLSLDALSGPPSRSSHAGQAGPPESLSGRGL